MVQTHFRVLQSTCYLTCRIQTQPNILRASASGQAFLHDTCRTAQNYGPKSTQTNIYTEKEILSHEAHVHMSHNAETSNPSSSLKISLPTCFRCKRIERLPTGPPASHHFVQGRMKLPQQKGENLTSSQFFLFSPAVQKYFTCLLVLSV